MKSLLVWLLRGKLDEISLSYYDTNSAFDIGPEDRIMATSKKILKVVLTGGPCGGKTSCLGLVKEVFAKKGISVLTVPEVPTLLQNGGCRYPGTSPTRLSQLIEFEAALLRLQRDVEDCFITMASIADDDKRSIVVCDRGLADPMAYCPPDPILWHEIIERSGFSNHMQLLGRYDLVLHLESAALGAEDNYTLENNAARVETVNEARNLDQLVKLAYQGHKNHVIVSNAEVKSFDEKIEVALNHIIQHYEKAV